MKDLQAERGLSYLFVAHDLSVVENISARVAVMFAGRIVETAPTEALFRSPHHPYTMSLLDSVLQPDPQRRRPLRANVQGPAEPREDAPALEGCPFQTRCRFVEARCRAEAPTLRPVAESHFAACHIAESVRDRAGLTLAAEPGLEPHEESHAS